jgi:hypothetical protein
MSNRRLLSVGGKVVEERAIRKFEAGLRGQLILPLDEAYESARRVRNRAIDRHPGVIVRCAAESDVIRAVGFARENARYPAV